MKISTTLLVIAVSTVGFLTKASAQSPVTVSASATLITPIAIEKKADLNFGSLASSASAGTVVLGFDDDATPALGVSSPDAGATATTAWFTVTGATSSTFSITFPTTLTLSNGTDNLAVTGITSDSGTSSALVEGTKDFKLGATLSVPARATAGDYINTEAFEVSVNYN